MASSTGRAILIVMLIVVGGGLILLRESIALPVNNTTTIHTGGENSLHGSIPDEADAIGQSVIAVADRNLEFTMTNVTARLVSSTTLAIDWLNTDDLSALDEVPYWIVAIEGSGLTVGDIVGGPFVQLGTPPPPSSVDAAIAYGLFHVWEANGGLMVSEGALEDPTDPDAWFTYERLEEITSEPLTITEATALPYLDDLVATSEALQTPSPTP